ncbi:MAG: hypothetical protein ACE5JH_05250 [Acidobacteriota bacterium]
MRTCCATLAAALVLGGLACGPPGDGVREVSRSLGRTARDLAGTAAEVRRALEDRAVDARDDLEAACRAAERALAERMDRPAATAERVRRRVRRVRERAERALHRGGEFLRRAARDGGETAEGWARLIQEKMMRLERLVDALSSRDGPEHADS